MNEYQSLFARALRGEQMTRAEREHIQYIYDCAQWEICWQQVNTSPDQWILTCAETQVDGNEAMLVWPERMTAHF